MGFFDLMAEARIREWQQRETDPKKTGDNTLVITGNEPMEVQLFKEILVLHKAAGNLPDSQQQQELLEKARQLQIQLMVVLEHSDRPLAAQQVAENIRLDLALIKDSYR